MKHIVGLTLLCMPTILLGAGSEQVANGFDFKTLIQAIGSLVAAAVAYIQIKSARPISRASLKTDLEILKLIAKSDPNYQIVKNDIDLRIKILYRRNTKPANWFIVSIGVSLAVAFSYWTFHIVRNEFSWWSLMTGYFAITGLYLIALGFSGNSKQLQKLTGGAFGSRPPNIRLNWRRKNGAPVS